MAAYWLFVVLMLATFTANLAAFLTVERMQTTVQSLEELVGAKLGFPLHNCIRVYPIICGLMILCYCLT